MKTCIGCGVMYAPRGTRSQRCAPCAVEHHRLKNQEYQHAFRARHRSKEDAERIERRTWQMDAVKSRAESLVADGLTATACAVKLGCSHHTLLRHLEKPEVRRRVSILMRDTGEPELPC